MSNNQQSDTQTFCTLEVWKQYEGVAMHFNDLLMRLRSQSLAGIAAISTLVGAFTRGNVTDTHMELLIFRDTFAAMAFVWFAIFCLDVFYYNRLLMGAVAAIIKLEKESGLSKTTHINLSTLIEAEFSKRLFGKNRCPFGVLVFYSVVFLVILAGFIISWEMM